MSHSYMDGHLCYGMVGLKGMKDIIRRDIYLKCQEGLHLDGLRTELLNREVAHEQEFMQLDEVVEVAQRGLNDALRRLEEARAAEAGVAGEA